MVSRKRVTIADVAKAAGVSPGTVSRVLNQRNSESKISEATQKLVLAVVEELGYQPNLFASALRTQRTGVIGAVVRDINDPFLGLMARELQKMAHAKGIELLLAHAEYDPEIARRQFNVMRNWFDGLLLIGDMLGHRAAISSLSKQEALSAQLAQNAKSSIPLVSIDDAHGTLLGIDYLYNLGHRRIAFIGNTEYAGIRQRFETLKQFVNEKDLFWVEDYCQSCRNDRNAAITATQNLLNLPTPPTAIFCMADLLALGALSAAWHAGWRVPETISILGFDDIEESVTAFPALTTIRQPVKQMAVEAFGLLMQLIDDPLSNDLQVPVIVQPELIVRNSCSPPIA